MPRRVATERDFFADTWGQEFPEPKKLTAHRTCVQCKKYCKVMYVDHYEWQLLVSECCEAKTKVTRYVYTKKKKGR